jgi:hypothetical protein
LHKAAFLVLDHPKSDPLQHDLDSPSGADFNDHGLIEGAQFREVALPSMKWCLQAVPEDPGPQHVSIEHAHVRVQGHSQSAFWSQKLPESPEIVLLVVNVVKDAEGIDQIEVAFQRLLQEVSMDESLRPEPPQLEMTARQL